METMAVYAWIFPVSLLAMAAAIVVGVRSSGRERTGSSEVETRLRERTFTGADRVSLEWPKERRRPTLATVVSMGESYGYRLLDRVEREHVVVLEFERIRTDRDL